MRIAIERDSLSNQMVARRVLTHTFEPGAPIASWDQRTFDEGMAVQDKLTRMAATVASQPHQEATNLPVAGDRDRLNGKTGPGWLDAEAHSSRYPSFRETYRIGTGAFHGERVTVYEVNSGLYDKTQWLVHPSGAHTMVQTYGEDCSS